MPQSLIDAARAEGNLTTIALPHSWCDYGDLLKNFSTGFGIKINELNPDGGSKDEITAIEANKTNKGPAAPDVVDVGLVLRPAGQDGRRLPALQGRDLGLASRPRPRMPTASGTATTTACSPSR